MTLLILGLAVLAWKFNETTDELTKTTQAFSEEKTKNQELQVELAKVNGLLAKKLAQKPGLPLRLTFTKSLMGKGQVAVFKNTSSDRLTFALRLHNPTLSIRKTFRVDLAPDEQKPFGHLEGWRFESGDEIILTNNNFEAMRLVVP